MKTIIYGIGKGIEEQYAKCLTYAMVNGYDSGETIDNMPKVIERLAKRDIQIVLVANKNLIADDWYELEIIRSTFERYGASLVSVE